MNYREIKIFKTKISKNIIVTKFYDNYIVISKLIESFILIIDSKNVLLGRYISILQLHFMCSALNNSYEILEESLSYKHLTIICVHACLKVCRLKDYN